MRASCARENSHETAAVPLRLICALPLLVGGLVEVAHGYSASLCEPIQQVELPSRVTLARLLDLAASQSAVQVNYPPAELEKVTVALRLPGTIDSKELWNLTNQLLAENGFTTIRAAGSRGLTVVKLDAAAGLARVEDPGTPVTEPEPGFVSRLVTVAHRPAKEMVESVKLTLTKTGGVVAAVGDGGELLISDLRPRVDQATWLLNQLDVERDAPVIERMTVAHRPASQIAAIVAAALEARKGVAATPLRGSLKTVASGDDTTLLLVAPSAEVDFFRELVGRFDREAGVVTSTYAPNGFDLDQVSSLLEQTVRDIGPRGSGERWRIVRDPLSGALVLTASPFEHEKAKALFERLAALPPEAKQPVRTFPIRNRSVDEVLNILKEMVAAGILAADIASGSGRPFDASAASQRTQVNSAFRDVVNSTPPSVAATPDSAGLNSASSGDVASGNARGDTARSARTDGALERQANLRLTADKSTNTLIATGDPRVLDELAALLPTIDVRQPQVMLEVLVLSLTDSQAMQLGIELENVIRTGETVARLASVFGLGLAAGVGPPGGPFPAAPLGGSAIVLQPGDFGALIQALETLNEGRSLNIPKILTNNNEQGTLDSTLQVPYLSTNASTTVATTSYGGSENAGTTVTIRPQIAAGDHLRLEYAVALSSFTGPAASPSLPPPKQQNNLKSVVTIPDGFTVALGGLEITTEGETIQQLPFVGSIPILGELFKNRNISKSTSKFYVFITAQVLRRDGFGDLKHMSEVETSKLDVSDGFPTLEPRIIR